MKTTQKQLWTWPLLVVLAALCLTTPAWGIARSWTHASSQYWSDPNNWNPAGVPQNGDDLNFFDTFIILGPDAMVNDMTDLVVHKMWFGFNGTHSASWTLNGNRITVTGSIEGNGSTPEDIYINCDVQLGANASFTTAWFGSTIKLHLKNVELNTHNLVLAGMEAGEDGFTEVSGVISGTGNITVLGIVKLTGTEANTYQGKVTVTSTTDGLCDYLIGYLILDKDSGPAITGNLRLENGGRFKLERSEQIADNAAVQVVGAVTGCFGGQLASSIHLNGYDETIGALAITNRASETNACLVATEGGTLTVANDIFSRSDNNNTVPTITGRLNLSSFHHWLLSGTGDIALQVDAQVVGPGSFIKYGNPTLILTGDNTFSGGVQIIQGLVDARNNNAFGTGAVELLWAAPGNGGALLLRNVSIGANPLWAQGADQVTAQASGSRITSFGTCSWAGPVTLWTNLVIIGGDMAFTGQVSGQGGFYFLNFGTSQLGGPDGNTYTGPTVVNCPALEFNKPLGVVAFGGPLVVGGNSYPVCEARWLQDYQHVYANVTVFPNGLVNLNNHRDDFYTLNFYGGTVDTGLGGELGIYAPVTVNPTNAPAFINGNLGLPLGAYPNNPFNVSDSPGIDCDLTINANIVGGGSLIKNGPGTLCLNGNSTYTGATFVHEGILSVEYALALGANNIGQGTVVYDGATLRLAPGVALSEPLSLAGAGVGGTLGALNVSGTTTFESPFQAFNYFDLSAGATIRVEGAASTFVLNGIISGNGPLTKAGPGRMVMAGSYGNSYSGDTLVVGGTLELNKPIATTVIPGNLVIGTGAIGVQATVRQDSSFLIVGNVTLHRGGLWDLYGNAEGFSNPDHPVVFQGGGAIQTGTGILYLPPGNSLTYNATADSGPSSVSGQIGLDAGPHVWWVAQHLVFGPGSSADLDVTATVVDSGGGAGNLEKQGGGLLRLSGPNTYSGTTTLAGGKLQADGGSQSAVIVSGGILQGSGAVGPITMRGGTVSPGASPGILASGVFNAGGGTGTLRVELNGPDPGTGYDQLQVSGGGFLQRTVTLTGLNLDASLGFTPAEGTQFVIVNNLSTFRGDYTGGAFNGLPQGASLAIGGRLFYISYNAGGGNDVVLTDAGPLPTLVIERAASNTVSLLWPTNFSNFTLQSSTNLTANNWSSVLAAPSVIGTNNVVTNAIDLSQRFYRLFK